MIKGIPLMIGGVEYVLPPLSLGALEDHAEAIDKFQSGELGLKGFGVVIDVVHASLLRNYPQMTREQVRQGIDLETAGEFFSAVMDISGIKRKALEAGKAAAGP